MASLDVKSYNQVSPNIYELLEVGLGKERRAFNWSVVVQRQHPLLELP